MKNRLRLLWFMAAAFAAFPYSEAANYLGANQVLQRGEYLESLPLGNYRLPMQSDGSLVMYRKDGTIRYRMAKHGQFAIMQSNGDFVEYSPFAQELWNTGTNVPNSIVAIQDDGNLVIYSPNGTPLWHIGAEPGPDSPSSSGEVVGRDLNIKGVGWVGHVGFFDGSNIIEAVVPQSGANAIRVVTVNEFMSESPYWGKAAAKFPNALMVKSCFKDFCSASGVHYEQTTTKVAMARRALQILLLGADYTLSAAPTRALYANEYYRAQRGKYRCDTFVADVMSYNSIYQGTMTRDQRRWYEFINQFTHTGSLITPRHLFNSLAEYK